MTSSIQSSKYPSVSPSVGGRAKSVIRGDGQICAKPFEESL